MERRMNDVMSICHPFAKNLKEVMTRKKVSGALLARETGYSKAAISQYMNGINFPSQKRIEAIAAVLEVNVEELTAASAQGPAAASCESTVQPYMQKATLTCKEAAALLHKHESFIRKGLQEGRPGFEYGSAVKTSGKWSYCIYANKFTEVTGIPVNRV